MKDMSKKYAEYKKRETLHNAKLEKKLAAIKETPRIRVFRVLQVDTATLHTWIMDVGITTRAEAVEIANEYKAQCPETNIHFVVQAV